VAAVSIHSQTPLRVVRVAGGLGWQLTGSSEAAAGRATVPAIGGSPALFEAFPGPSSRVTGANLQVDFDSESGRMAVRLPVRVRSSWLPPPGPQAAELKLPTRMALRRPGPGFRSGPGPLWPLATAAGRLFGEARPAGKALLPSLRSRPGPTGPPPDHSREARPAAGRSEGPAAGCSVRRGRQRPGAGGGDSAGSCPGGPAAAGRRSGQGPPASGPLTAR
jgi:hypothetical protein